MKLIRKSKRRGYRETVLADSRLLHSTTWGQTRAEDCIRLRFDGDGTASYHLDMSRVEVEHLIVLLRQRLDAVLGAY